MRIDKITENDDGTATLDCTFEHREAELLIEYAVVSLLKEFAERQAKKEGDK